MRFELSIEEASFLKGALLRHIAEVDDELVHTDKHQLQHALAQDVDRLKKLLARLEHLLEQRDAVG